MTSMITRIRPHLYTIWLAAIALVTVLTRTVGITRIQEKIFDEIYFPVMAWSFLQGRLDYDSHPPFGKFLIALGELVFGNTPLGWRIVPALLGCALVAIAGMLMYRLTENKLVAYITASFFALDGMLIVYSRTGLMDGALMAFSLGAVLLALTAKRPAHILWVFTVLGMAVAIKWIALAIIVPLMLILWRRKLFVDGLFGLGMGFTVYAIILLAARLITGTENPIQDAWDWHPGAYGYHKFLTDSHPWGSPWWSWPLQLRPLLMHYAEDARGVSVMTTLSNPLLYWSATLVVLGTLIERVVVGLRTLRGLIKDKSERMLRSKGFLTDVPTVLIAGYLSAYVPWVDVSRVVFHYHYLAAHLFALCLTAYWLARLATVQRGVVIALCAVYLWCGFYFLPWATGAYISKPSYVNHLWLHSWLYEFRPETWWETVRPPR
jgi:dolichyl-phosphate-mannose--protein O-mannosyl transferase